MSGSAHSTRKVLVGDVSIGGGSPVRVQSMTNTPTVDVTATLEQVRELAFAGAEMVRIAVPDAESAAALPAIVAGAPVPLVADIQFDADLALASLDAGVAKLRLNPGNLRRPGLVAGIAREASARGVPIRVGANSGSVPGDLRQRFGGPGPECLWEAARRQIQILEDSGFHDIVVSLKSSSPRVTIDANRIAAAECDYPLHLGVTEAGTTVTGGIRSASALAVLLEEGTGDTIRVSLSADPVREVHAGWAILASLGLRERGPTIISCPTCARARLDVAALAEQVESMISTLSGVFSIAIMGCEVNGPGEAREADLAVIGTPTGLMLFRDGRVVEKLDLPEGQVANGPRSVHLTDHLKTLLEGEIRKLTGHEEV